MDLTNLRDRDCPNDLSAPPLLVAARGQPSAPHPAAWLRPVYVSDDVDMELSTSGYAFDSEVLEGLWLEGRRAFMNTSDDVVRWLGPGWRRLGTSDPRRSPIPGYEEFVVQERLDLEASAVAWRVGWYATSSEDRAREHRRQLQANLKVCPCDQDSCRQP